ncbi:methylenetetrahydrofolate reductase C-terminal domain-containing protein [Acidiferrimicrobium sp. IK]|uniref:methylenetetrahydrofolate reductase C-terminal domain-containing protein n=1 Tax=Acidiferrimicrobium sp. IK TaxID=2871700 RepID=UPI0021CAEBCB|nr:methylenetetrahydrofolate reductase C-terminal domain-containing protein [Acidiferrimicrobium sp. IK]MCU4183308.1 methylenetetrahydrofolate reductase C-terminal domain-containing protein [Acidiferrimicrobium sp. IK]
MPVESSSCPKHMVFGPCGGVDPGGGCEVDRRPCPFVTSPGPAWRAGAPTHKPHALTAAAYELASLASRRPLVLAEVPSVSLDACRQREAAAVLARGCDAGVTGDSPWARVQLPPTVRAELLADEGLRAWVGLTCRDRNRVALEGELAGLNAVGAAAVHCVTGDHPTVGDRPDAAAVFDLDSTRLAAMAAGTGMLVSVAESPSSPPEEQRAARLANKAEAGAGWCLLAFTGDGDRLAEFVAAVRGLAPGLRPVISVPVLTSPEALRLVGRYPALSLPAAAVAAVEDAHPHTAGLDAAHCMALAALAIEGVAGVSLAAPAIPDRALAAASDVVALGRALGGGQ